MPYDPNYGQGGGYGGYEEWPQNYGQPPQQNQFQQMYQEPQIYEPPQFQQFPMTMGYNSGQPQQMNARATRPQPQPAMHPQFMNRQDPMQSYGQQFAPHRNAHSGLQSGLPPSFPQNNQLQQPYPPQVNQYQIQRQSQPLREVLQSTPQVQHQFQAEPRTVPQTHPNAFPPGLEHPGLVDQASIPQREHLQLQRQSPIPQGQRASVSHTSSKNTELQRTISSLRQSSAQQYLPASQASRSPSQPTTISPPASTSRPVAYVQVPRQAVEQMPAPPPKHKSPKRRKSNDGTAVIVCNAPPQPPRTEQPSYSNLPASSPLTELASSQVPQQPPRSNVDYHSLLFGLAEEYISVAHSMTSALDAQSMTEDDIEEYAALMSTAMGCLESVLKNHRPSDPRDEARIRLRLATLLHEETENEIEAEEILSKGIALCERSRLTDLKYAMHHLLVRIMFKSKPRAALKAAEKLVTEVEALQLGLWTFIFRLLRVSLGMGSLVQGDTSAILKQLAAVAALAEKTRSIAMQIMAALLESMVHLRSSAPDAVELSERALSTARTHQLSNEMKQMPQAIVLLDLLDLASTLVGYAPDAARKKMEQMQKNLDPMTKDPNWSKNGCFKVGLAIRGPETISGDTQGIMCNLPNGEIALSFQWLASSELYALAYWLSSVVSFDKNSQDGKALKYAEQALKCTLIKPDRGKPSLNSASRSRQRVQHLRSIIHMHIAWTHCSHADWPTADKHLADARADLKLSSMQLAPPAVSLLTYLGAMCKQGNGDLKNALDLYSSPQLAFDANYKTKSALRDLAAMALLNSVLIMRSVSTSKSAEADQLLSKVEPYCQDHPNKAMTSAFYMIKGTSATGETLMIKTKQHIQAALQAAKQAGNNQLLCIIMSTMTQLFFANIVGEQAEKSANAARTLSKKVGDKLWIAVTDGMYSDTLERCGKHEQAKTADEEGRQAMQSLSGSLRAGLEARE